LIQGFLNANVEDSAARHRDRAGLPGHLRRILDLVELDGQRGNEVAIEKILGLAQVASSKDIRDKIYGIYGLLPKTLLSRIQPDYKLPVEEVF
jgi:hypothetical protein